MVWVGSLFVNGGTESLEPVVQFTGERNRHVRRPERRHHLEARLLQIPDAVEAEDREPSKWSGAEIIDIGVALGVHPREPPTAPIGEPPTEQPGLNSGFILHVLLAAHHDQGVDWIRHPPDPWYPLGHRISIASASDTGLEAT